MTRKVLLVHPYRFSFLKNDTKNSPGRPLLIFTIKKAKIILVRLYQIFKKSTKNSISLALPFSIFKTSSSHTLRFPTHNKKNHTLKQTTPSKLWKSTFRKLLLFIPDSPGPI
jgi:HKD family nuclease